MSPFVYALIFLLGYDVQNCSLPVPATRTGRQDCWAQLSFPNSRKLCISKEVWIEQIRELQPFCWNAHSSVKTITFRENSLHFSPYQQHPPKKTLSLQHYRKRDKDQLFRHQTTISRLGKAIFKSLSRLEILREHIASRLEPSDRLGLLSELIVDQKKPGGAANVLRHLGFVHLTTASGIHLLTLIGILKHLKKKTRITRRTFHFILLSTLSMVWLLSGCRLGLLRPAGVLALKWFSQKLGFQWKKLSPLFFALLLEFLIAAVKSNHYSQDMWHHGRWIYALAVGGGILFYDSFRSFHLGLAIGSWILTAFLEVWHSGLLSLATPALSLITLPVICTFVYPATLIALILSPIEGLSHGVDWIGFGFTEFLKTLIRLSLLPGNLWITARSSLFFGIIFGSFLFFWFPGRCTKKSSLFEGRKKLLLFSCLFSLGFRLLLTHWDSHLHLWKPLPKTAASKNCFFVEQLDVGQGDAAILGCRVQNENRWLSHSDRWHLLDVGPDWAMSDSSWIEYFGLRGIQEIDTLWLSHLDEDHAGAITKIARLIPIHAVGVSVRELYTKRGRKLAAFLQNNKHTLIQVDQDLVHAGIHVKSFDEGKSRLKKKSSGNSNRVMLVAYASLFPCGSYLNAGDASSHLEIQILPWFLKNEKAHSCVLPETAVRILKVSHHGSKSSSSLEFLKAARPNEAWISRGLGNRYGHPHPTTLEKLKDLKIPIRDTGHKGSISYYSSLSRIPLFRSRPGAGLHQRPSPPQ